MSDRTFLGHRLVGSWLNTFVSVTGSRPHKPSFVVFDIGQSGCMLLAEWFRAHRKITFQEDILSQVVRFPRMSVYQHVRQSAGEIYGFNMTVEHLRQVQRMADPNQFMQDLVRGMPGNLFEPQGCAEACDRYFKNLQCQLSVRY